MTTDPLPFSAACERNKEPILDGLRPHLPALRASMPATAGLQLLEVGSGSGQHAVHMTRRLQRLQWQPTELPGSLMGLRRRIAMEGAQQPAGGSSIRPPLELDVTRPEQWPAGPFDLLFTANTIHIMPAEALPHLLEGAARVLRPGGLLVIYGPFRYGDEHTAASNVAFDAHLRSIDPAMGIRDALALRDAASRLGLELLEDRPMPANNRLLLLRRGGRVPAEEPGGSEIRPGSDAGTLQNGSSESGTA